MSITHAPEGATVVDDDREWRIHRCAHGCVHLTLDRLMLTFTDHEFRVFARLVSQAVERLDAEKRIQPLVRAH